MPVTRHIPVILLTATLRLATQQTFVSAGARAVLVKPFDPGLLGGQIEAVLGWQQEKLFELFEKRGSGVHRVVTIAAYG
jgi:CheY-like chemotaxis protein